MLRFFNCLCFISICLVVSAQEVQVDIDTSMSKTIQQDKVKRHSPKKAALRSAVLPGWGQIYNRKYWKLPIVYAGFGGLGFALGYNIKHWKTYSDAYRARVDNDTSTVDQYEGIYSENNLLILKKFYKRNVDLSIIFTAVWYALNIIDAAVDAHLFEYDISDDLTLRWDPVIDINRHNPAYMNGVKLSLKL